MYREDSELVDALQSAQMKIEPDPAHVGALRAQLAAMARSRTGDRRRQARNAWLLGLLACGVCGAGLAATQAGRDLIGWIFTPVQPRHTVEVTTPEGTNWSQGGAAEPYTPAQQQAAADLFGEIVVLSQAGLGELIGLLEGPEQTAYVIRYALKDGTTTTVTSGVLTDMQALFMRIDEIQRLRDTGAGDVIVQSRSPIGLGFYTIRLTLPDRTVDLQTHYPPGTREQREAIFAETRALKADLRFSVEQASASVENPEQGVVGLLRYTLADGRTVGIVERIPAEAITPDGAYVVLPGTSEPISIEPGGTWTSPDGTRYISIGGEEPGRPDDQEEVVEGFREIFSIKQAGGGRLVGLREGPGWDGALSTTTFRVRYTLESGETVTVAEGALSPAQRAGMRVDEIQRLRDAGAGEIVSQSESPLGLGRFTIRFTLSGGETVDLQTQYPPGTRREREAIFAATRRLKAQRRFSVMDAYVTPGAGVWGRLVYTLSDGRSVGHYEQVPTELISSDGRHVVMPDTGKSVEIKGSPEG